MNFLNTRMFGLAAGAAVLVAAVGSANATVVLVSMRYDSLAGSYDAALQQFTARAVDTASLRTSGNVSRLVSPTGQAIFEAGFVSAANPADFNINVTAIPTANPNRRSGVGSFASVDLDGDTISGDVSGTWISTPGYIFFNGFLTNVIITPSASEGTSFNGTQSGSFGLDFPTPPPYEGAVVQLVFAGNSNTFFANSFQDRATGVTAQLIPTPASVALMGLGTMVVVGGRRRR
ncbi:MAG: hypothetical protein WC718_03370 [Phycisphaerales bacterium]|jgi:hypothetical protein